MDTKTALRLARESLADQATGLAENTQAYVVRHRNDCWEAHSMLGALLFAENRSEVFGLCDVALGRAACAPEDV